MELILTLIGEFVIAPIMSFVSLVIQIVFWMCCWVVVGMWRIFSAAGRGLIGIFPGSGAGST